MSFLFTPMNMTKLDHRTFCASSKLTSQEIVYLALENATNSRRMENVVFLWKLVIAYKWQLLERSYYTLFSSFVEYPWGSSYWFPIYRNHAKMTRHKSARNVRLIGNFHGMFNWHMAVQSNLDDPDFSTIRTCLSGSSFLWILICHYMCPQQNFFPSSYVMKLRFELNLFRFRKHKSVGISRHNWYTAFHRVLIGSDYPASRVSFDLPRSVGKRKDSSRLI